MKKAIVIGATSGIGRGIAEILVKNGYIVGITGRRQNLLEELENENPSKYITSSFDLGVANEIPQKLNELTNELGGLDLLVISSGTGKQNEMLEYEIEKTTIDVNVSGFTAVCDWAFNYFKQQKGGHLSCISSVAGLRGSRWAPAYGATKAYQMNYFEALRQKAKKEKLDITITDIRPGFVDTAMAQGEGIFWKAPVDKATLQIYKGIAKKRRIVYVTKRWRLVAGLMKIMPNWLYEKI